MPIIDRWLAQAPHIYLLLANALAQGGEPTGSAVVAISSWRRMLTELEEAASAYNPNGVPTAVEGLLQLATYLRTSKSQDPDLARPTDIVERLARINAGYRRSPN